MITLHGIGVSGGVAFGKLHFLSTCTPGKNSPSSGDPQCELQRLRDARRTAQTQLKQFHEEAIPELGQDNAMIFEIHRMMLEEPDFVESMESAIKSDALSAEQAVSRSGKHFSELLASMDGEYMRQRAADVNDVADRLLRILSGRKEDALPDGDLIIAAEDLTPSQTIRLTKAKILAFVTQAGSASSHTAILSRTMGIPAVAAVGESLFPGLQGAQAAVDGDSGTLYINPDEETKNRLSKQAAELLARTNRLQSLRGKETCTRDKQSIDIYANIGSTGDLRAVLENDAGGVGLFRSEFLFLGKPDYPDEETQFSAYRKAAETCSGKRVVIRTMDIGADKKISYFNLPEEENPALGYRAIRICLDRTALFKTQLRALLRAGCFGRISVMFPMITSLEEIREIKALWKQAQDELRQECLPYGKDIELGIMVETPAAAMISDLLAPEVDFFSIGTNDLTQYTLAVDRQNPNLKRYLQPHHPAILRMIRQVAENAHRAGKWVGICGELAADTRLTEFFLAAGIDELSVSPPAVLPLREAVRSVDLTGRRASILSEYLQEHRALT